MRARIPQIIFAVGLVVLVVLLLALPQRRRLTYNPGSEVTIEGTVQQVNDFYCPISNGEGTHLLVATDAGVVQVHVAPKVFLRTNNWNFSPGDRVQIVGSRMIYAGHAAVVARTISRNNLTLAFREKDGKPLWTD